MIRISFYGMVVVSFFVAWFVKQQVAKKRLRDLDEGKRCMACNKNDMAFHEGYVVCRTCGHRVELAALQASKVSDAEMANMTRPDDPNRW